MLHDKRLTHVGLRIQFDGTRAHPGGIMGLHNEFYKLPLLNLRTKNISSTSHLSVQKINEYGVVFRCLQVLFADPGVSLYHLGRFGRSRRAIVLPIAAFQQKVFCGMIQHHHHHFPVRI